MTRLLTAVPALILGAVLGGCKTTAPSGDSSVKDWQNIRSIQARTDANGAVTGQQVVCLDGRQQFTRQENDGNYTVYESRGAPPAWVVIGHAAPPQIAAAVCSAAGEAAGALASYGCDGNGNFFLSVIGPDGTESKQNAPTNSIATCTEAAAALTATHAQIAGLTLAAVCDGNGNLYRFAMTPDGKAKALAQQPLNSMGTCRPLAAAIDAQPATAGDAGVPTALASYSCDGNGNFTLSVIGPAGAEATQSAPTNTLQSCSDAATALNARHARVAGLTLAAVCDGNGNLYRFSMMPSGAARALGEQPLNSLAACRPLAEAIDAQPANPGATGLPLALASYSCDGNGNFYLSVIGPDGAESKQTAGTNSVATCNAAVTALTNRHAQITRLTLAAVCDGNGNLYRFSMTPDGKARALEEQLLNEMSVCRTQADAIDAQP